MRRTLKMLAVVAVSFNCTASSPAPGPRSPDDRRPSRCEIEEPPPFDADRSALQGAVTVTDEGTSLRVEIPIREGAIVGVSIRDDRGTVVEASPGDPSSFSVDKSLFADSFAVLLVIEEVDRWYDPTVVAVDTVAFDSDGNTIDRVEPAQDTMITRADVEISSSCSRSADGAVEVSVAGNAPDSTRTVVSVGGVDTSPTPGDFYEALRFDDPCSAPSITVSTEAGDFRVSSVYDVSDACEPY